MKEKPWAGRFKDSTHRLVEEFTTSIPFDKRLYKHDIRGSIAHARMLSMVGIITEEEAEKIINGLEEIRDEIERGSFPFSIYLEDIHMNIEKRLIEKIGEVGEKLHSGRSRNDQIALDLRLYLREEIGIILKEIKGVEETILRLAKENMDIVMPGYTHLQRAQPVLLSHHLLAYLEMFKRDAERLSDCLKRFNAMPLGAGALAGSTLPLDRGYVAELLGFQGVTENSMDSVSDRDFCIEFLSASSILMMHLSRLSEELILWSTEEFGFIEISDAFTTGSSMMPQKKNPDVAELIRGKTGRVYGDLISLLTIMKALPLSYNRDMQEDKPPLFDAVDTVKACLSVLGSMLGDIRFKKDRMLEATKKGFLEATDVAEYLVQKGIPFRKAHNLVGRIVAYCIEKDKTLSDLSLGEWQGFSKDIDKDIFSVLKLDSIIEKRRIKGGTAREEVKKRIETLSQKYIK